MGAPDAPPMSEDQQRKTRAEAAKAEAEAAREAAETEKVRLEIEKMRIEMREAEAKARRAENGATLDELYFAQKKRAYDEEMSDDSYHHVYVFDGRVSGASVKVCMSQLNIWHRMEPGCDMEIRFWSEGGSIIDGMALFDFIQDLRRSGHKVTTAAYGYAASMAGILLQAGDTRVMAKESWLLIHEGSMGAVGSIGEVEDTVEWAAKLRKRIVSILVHRSKLTAAQIERKWNRKDWWIDSDEALKLGLVDEVR